MTAPVAFTATLTAANSTPYLGVKSVLSQYANAHLYGSKGYRLLQQRGRVDVLPSQVLTASGAWRKVNPIMGHTVTFTQAERSVAETLALLASEVSKASGKKVNLIDQPYMLLQQVDVGAKQELPGNILAKIGTALGGTPSYQCLYDASDEVYHLHIYLVSAF